MLTQDLISAIGGSRRCIAKLEGVAAVLERMPGWVHHVGKRLTSDKYMAGVAFDPLPWVYVRLCLRLVCALL